MNWIAVKDERVVALISLFVLHVGFDLLNNLSVLFYLALLDIKIVVSSIDVRCARYHLFYS